MANILRECKKPQNQNIVTGK